MNSTPDLPDPRLTPPMADELTRLVSWGAAKGMLGKAARSDWKLRIKLMGIHEPVVVDDLLVDLGFPPIEDFDICGRLGRVSTSYVIEFDKTKLDPADLDPADAGSLGGAVQRHWPQISHEEGPRREASDTDKQPTPDPPPGVMSDEADRKLGAIAVPWMVHRDSSGRQHVLVAFTWRDRPHIRPIDPLPDSGQLRDVGARMPELPRGFGDLGDAGVLETAAREADEELALGSTTPLWNRAGSARRADDGPLPAESEIGRINANSAFFTTPIAVVQRRYTETPEPSEHATSTQTSADLLEPIRYRAEPTEEGKQRTAPHYFFSLPMITPLLRQTGGGVPMCGLTTSALWVWYAWLCEHRAELSLTDESLRLWNDP